MTLAPVDKSKDSRFKEDVNRNGPTVGLLGPFGTSNLGNEATLSAVIQNFRRLEPRLILHGFSYDPEDTRRRYGIRAFSVTRQSPKPVSKTASKQGTQPNKPNWKSRLKAHPAAYRALRWLASPLMELAFLKRAKRSLKGIDLLLIVGTGLVEDSWGGPMRFPYTVFKWSLLARISKTNLAFVSVGAGPIRFYSSRRLLKWALSQAVFRSFRDRDSKLLVERIGVKGESHVYPDLVFGLRLPDVGNKCQDSPPSTVIVHGLPYRKPGFWSATSQEVYGRYVKTMAQFTCWLLDEGYTVRLVPTQLKMDQAFIEDLQEALRANPPKSKLDQLIAEPPCSFDEVISQLSSGSIVVASRFHAIIFSFLLSKPVLAFAYHSKMRELMKDFGQQGFCLDLPTMEFEGMVKKFTELQAAKGRVSQQVREKIELNKTLLEQQYHTLLELAFECH